MASNDASCAFMESTIRVLVSFFLATDETSSALDVRRQSTALGTTKGYPIDQTFARTYDVEAGPEYHAPVGQRAWQSRKVALRLSEQHQTCSKNSSSQYV